MRTTDEGRRAAGSFRPSLVKGGWDGAGSAVWPRVAFLSTFPPTRCGIATFTRALTDALARRRRARGGLGIIRVARDATLPDDGAAARVLAEVVPGSPGWVEAAVEATAGFDVLSVQHEYGIYGPDDGVALLDVLAAVDLPVITTLHTIPARPSARQKAILDGLMARSERVVVMAEVARERLAALHRADGARVTVIPHGAHGLNGHAPVESPPVVLTWGLIGPGKGLETGILAMRRLRDLDPPPQYVICGQTHPNVLRDQGESYRNRLEQLADEAGVSDMVRIVSGYMDLETLAAQLGRAAVVLLPYDSREQVTSGVLVEALGAGKPVVATAFPHAVEVLSAGAGRVVPHQDPDAAAVALAELLTEPAGEEARSAARVAGARLLWPVVASQFEAEALSLVQRQRARTG